MIFMSKDSQETIHGEKVNEGKTKIIWGTIDNAVEVLIESKDIIPARDGIKQDIILENKGILSTETTCNCFQLLNNEGIATYFIRRADENDFRARSVQNIPIEFVVRRIAAGDYLKRHPGFLLGKEFEKPVIEFFLKDDRRQNPLMSWIDEKGYFNLYEAEKPWTANALLGSVDPKDLFSNGDLDVWRETITLLNRTTKNVFLILEEAWKKQNVVLVDLKIECGYDVQTDEILVTGVIDNEAWHIFSSGRVYCNLTQIIPGNPKSIKRNYTQVAKMTAKFLK